MGSGRERSRWGGCWKKTSRADLTGGTQVQGRESGVFFPQGSGRTPPQRLEGLVPAGGLELCIHCELLPELLARLRNEQLQDGHRAHACSPGVRASLGGQRDARTDTDWMDPRELPRRWLAGLPSHQLPWALWTWHSFPPPGPPHKAIVSSAHLILPAHSWTFFGLSSNVTSSKRPSWFLPI